MYTIGQLAKLSGLPVKTIRFYSDSGVLPEHERTAAGYRLYREEDRARLEVIRTLREIGVDLATIRGLGDRDLRDVLTLHLQAVETRLRALQRTRAVLRATLDKDDPTDDDLHRLNALGRYGTEEMGLLLDDFMDDVAGANGAREEWLEGLRCGMAVELPDEPTIEQLDAWLEMTALLADDGFRAALRGQSSDFWENTDQLDLDALRETTMRSIEDAMAAVHAGVTPDSPAALPVLDGVLSLMAKGRGVLCDAEFRNQVRREYDQHDQRSERYWELVYVIREWSWPPEQVVANRWIHDALRHHDHFPP
ncbi:MerR family transcriptional regulator [Spongiactinospora sp. TRM90649]|uniref:MerR family transcriptional regulator n=1 Tax=Spongiactinospora sp. TRM90649 TaxID=3031114 RepID=UPI0023FA25E5|nr:MerR family transcriptional regulator [Spongiactinospora sp. TRM90649]MDF5753019.1 MerR family transcriptional regulator [Spongiactinospora sp. TRM90649]